MNYNHTILNYVESIGYQKDRIESIIATERSSYEFASTYAEEKIIPTVRYGANNLALEEISVEGIEAAVSTEIKRLSELHRAAEKSGDCDLNAEDFRQDFIDYCSVEAVVTAHLFIQTDVIRQDRYPDVKVIFPERFFATFNGARCGFDPFEENAAEKLKEAWLKQMEVNRQAYMESDVYKEQQRRNEVEVAEIQKEIDVLILALPQVISVTTSNTEMLTWLKKYTDKADRVGVNKHLEAVIAAFEAAGYQANEFVGDEEVRTDDNKCFRWLMGQALDCMKGGMPPHPVSIRFIDELLDK